MPGRADPTVVAAELEARIDAIAAQLHITTQTVLRTYIDEDWAGQMAETMMADLQGRQAATVVPGAPEHFAVRVAGRLLAALGQAMLYATTNNDPRQPLPAMDLRQAAEAVTGLGLAVHECPPASNSSPSAPTSWRGPPAALRPHDPPGFITTAAHPPGIGQRGPAVRARASAAHVERQPGLPAPHPWSRCAASALAASSRGAVRSRSGQAVPCLHHVTSSTIVNEASPAKLSSWLVRVNV